MMSEKICGEFCVGICQISCTGRFCVRTIGASCGIFFCLSVLSHNHSCGAGAPVIVRLSCAWPPPPHLGGHIRNAPCINYQVCARGVFRSQSARPFISMLLSGMKCPGFQYIWAKTRENGAFYGSRPVGNAGESICFRDSDRQIGSCHNASLGQFFTHSMHRMHSVPILRFLELSVTSTFIGQTRLHFPQEIHFSLSHFTRRSAK